MNQQRTKPIEEPEERDPIPYSGKDEMNLAEFPFATLRRYGDSRKAIIYEGQIVDKDGTRQDQKWVVQGGSLVGLPTEFDERVFVALMAITVKNGFVSRKVPFSVYQIIRTMGLTKNNLAYKNVEDSLDRLVGVTIKSEGAFWDNDTKERITTKEAFHLIDKYWLRYREKDEKIREREGVPGYIVWGEDIWRSIKANYIKPLDIHFFYSLQTPLARRLYRFLDKRMQYQDKYEIDIFDLAGRLGMVYYAKPAWIARKLQPALDELIAKAFLRSAKVVKHKGTHTQYTRIRFIRAPKSVLKTAEPDNSQEETETFEDLYTARLVALRQRYGITDDLVDIWEEALTEIEGATTQPTFQMWFPNCHLLAIKDNIALIGVPSPFAQQWLEGRMTPVIKRALEGATRQPIEQLAFQVLESPQNTLTR